MEQLNDAKEVTLSNILSKITDEMEDWLIIGDHAGKIIYANHSVLEACSYLKEQVLGEDMYMFVGIDLEDEKNLKYIQEFRNVGEKIEIVTSRLIEENKRIYLANTLITVKNSNDLAYYVCISKDISKTLKLEEEVYKASYLDSLTNYPNQKHFIRSVEKHITKAKQAKNKLAIILLDIGRIGRINTEYGMSVSELVIKEVGKRIKKEIGNKQEIFKYKGNVFAILHQDLVDEKEIEQFLLKVYQAIEDPLQIQSRSIYVELNGGIAVYPNDGISTAHLIEQAEIAHLYAKRQKKSTGSYVYYSKSIQEEVELARQIEEDLQQAVVNDEMIVYYQPLLDLREQRLVGMEALIRRQKQDGQIILPGAFISALERMNLIDQIGIRVLEKVCIQIRQWLDKDYNVVPISVNLSALQFRNPHLADDIKEVLVKYNIEPCYIVLEITESAVMEDIEMAKMTIQELKEYGFAISIDDFGTGYASIGYLKKFMFDSLKIDISFIREIVASSESQAIVQAIISIAKTLHLKTIAEGIEDEDQLYVISELGCEVGQGYLWDKPTIARNIEEKYFMGL